MEERCRFRLPQDRAHEGLDGDLRAHGVPRQAEDRGVLHGAQAELAPRRHGDGVEAHRAQGGQDVLDGIALPDRQAAGGDQDVRPHELILDGLGQGAELVRHGGDAEGPSTGIGDGRGQGVPIGVEDVARAPRPARLDQLVADRHDDDSRRGQDLDAVAPDTAQQGDLAGGDARAPRQHRGTGGDVVGPAPHIVAGAHDGADPNPGPPAIGDSPGHDGIGAQR